MSLKVTQPNRVDLVLVVTVLNPTKDIRLGESHLLECAPTTINS